jgi:hypothetical protein
MRRPLSAELSADDRSLARRWVIGTASVYWTIAIVLFGAVLASSSAEKVTVAAKSERTVVQQDRLGVRPYGSLPNIAQAILVCTASQPCKANGFGPVN